MRLVSFSWTKLILLEVREERVEAEVVIQKCRGRCWSCSTSWMVSSLRRISRLSWLRIVLVRETFSMLPSYAYPFTLDILDSALLRPGRIDRKIEFPPPGPEARVSILRIHSRKVCNCRPCV